MLIKLIDQRREPRGVEENFSSRKAAKTESHHLATEETNPEKWRSERGSWGSHLLKPAPRILATKAFFLNSIETESRLECSCLENPRDRGACGLPSMGSHSRMRLKRLSSSSSGQREERSEGGRCQETQSFFPVIKVFLSYLSLWVFFCFVSSLVSFLFRLHI